MDITEQLRDDPIWGVGPGVAEEAASEIERLRKEIETLSAQLKPYQEVESKWQKLHDILKDREVRPCDCSQQCMGDEYLCANWYARETVKGGK